MKTAVITGAGSGVGRATAVALASQGWNVAILGRRENALLETAGIAGEHGGKVLVCPCDIGDEAAVAAMGKRVFAEIGEVEVLVNAAGTNAPKRALEVLSSADFHDMMNANLHGAYYCVQAFLPGMRARGSGTIVNVISDAGKAASPKAGPAYVMSKFGLSGLTQSINAEERGRGVRAIGIFPGDIDTPLLKKRPVVPDADALAKMMRAEDVADCIVFSINMPAHVIIEEMIVRPR
ncbi:short-chain dehydrogenase [Verrucomicrobiota bacterium]|nr:short-chain dehydrogenase [Verrucomicrobiota bacterium]